MNTNTGKVFVYWDNSNIFISAKYLAEEREGPAAFHRVRIAFRNLFELACANRPVERAIAVGSVPPPLEHLWNRLSQEGVEVELLERGSESNTEQGVDESLQNAMLFDALKYNGTPGIVVLLSGDGKGFYQGKGFHKTIEAMHERGWQIEVVSWRSSCHKSMLDWVQENGVFVALDDFYESVTFLQRNEEDGAPQRNAVPMDLNRRPTAP